MQCFMHVIFGQFKGHAERDLPIFNIPTTNNDLVIKSKSTYTFKNESVLQWFEFCQVFI